MPSSTSSTDLLEVARIRGVHGLAGLVKVELYWSDSAALVDGAELIAEARDGRRRSFVVERAAPGPKSWLVKFEGIDDRTNAEVLAGSRLFVERAALGQLEPGEAYLVDLVGAEVLAPDGLVGRVVQVLVNPSVDSVVVEDASGRRFEQPLAPTFVERIEHEGRRIYLLNRDGLIE